MTNEDFLNHFDSIFNTETIKKVNLKDKKLLLELYRRLEEDLLTTNQEYKEVRKRWKKIDEVFTKSLTDEQLKLYDKFDELRNEMHSIEFEQVFIFGYIIAKELDNESKLKDA